tara:strand:+ start:194 stop:295 length:102 start_codon:yes stop_codon:yes gene_type:complete
MKIKNKEMIVIMTDVMIVEEYSESGWKRVATID